MTNASSVPPIDTPEVIDPQSPPWSRTTRRVVAVILIAIVALLIWRFQGLLAQIVLAWLVAYLLNPVINAIARRFEKVSRTAATLMVYLLMLLILIGVIAMIGVAAVNQITALVERLPTLIGNVVESVGNLTDNPNAGITIGPYKLSLADINLEQLETELLTMVNPALATGGTAAGAVAGSAINVVGTFLLMFIISLYIALDLPRFGQDWEAIAQQSGYYADFERIKKELLQIGNAYLRGQAILGLVVGTLTAVLLAILGVENALAIGILSGVLELIPYFGPVISAIVAVLIAFFQPVNYLGLGQVQFALAVLAVMVLIQQVENNFLVPRIVGDALNLKPLTVMVAVIMGGALFGLLGIIMAGPVAAALKLIGGYMWRKMLGLPPFPPEEEEADDIDRPSLLGRTLGMIRSSRHRAEEAAAAAAADKKAAKAAKTQKAKNPARSVDPPPPGEGDPPSAAAH